KAVARDVLEHVEHALIARVVGVGPEIVARARRAAQRRREPTEEVLRLEHSDLLTAFREREAGGESADAAADDDRMSQRETSMGMTRAFEVSRMPRRPYPYSRSVLRGLPRAVYLLAVTSFSADVSTEMLYPVLPLFLTQELGAPRTVVGVVEGVAEATQNIVQGGSGWLADRLGRNKPVAVVGYALAALAKPTIGLATAWPSVLASR